MTCWIIHWAFLNRWKRPNTNTDVFWLSHTRSCIFISSFHMHLFKCPPPRLSPPLPPTSAVGTSVASRQRRPCSPIALCSPAHCHYTEKSCQKLFICSLPPVTAPVTAPVAHRRIFTVLNKCKWRFKRSGQTTVLPLRLQFRSAQLVDLWRQRSPVGF